MSYGVVLIVLSLLVAGFIAIGLAVAKARTVSALLRMYPWEVAAAVIGYAFLLMAMITAGDSSAFERLSIGVFGGSVIIFSLAAALWGFGAKPPGGLARWFVGCVIPAALGFGLFAVVGEDQKPEATINGDLAYKTVILSTNTFPSVHGIARDATWTVYDLAVAYPALKRIELRYAMRGDSLVDRYGNKLVGNLQMGTLSVTDLDDVRRFKGRTFYSIDETVQALYKAQILRFDHSHHLRR